MVDCSIHGVTRTHIRIVQWNSASRGTYYTIVITAYTSDQGGLRTTLYTESTDVVAKYRKVADQEDIRQAD